jgi:hypothetical protein
MNTAQKILHSGYDEIGIFDEWVVFDNAQFESKSIDQDWKHGVTSYLFNDGSILVFTESDVAAYNNIESVRVDYPC